MVTGSVAVDVAVGLVFTYLVFSTLCSGVNEGISQFLNRRGRELFDTINALLGDKTIQERFWAHPLIAGLIRSRNLEATAKPFFTDGLEAKLETKLRTKTFRDIAPSYISPSTFAKVILDITGRTSAETPPPVTGPTATAGAPADPAPTVMLPVVSGSVQIAAIDSIVRTAGADLSRAQDDIEKWFNDTMDRLSGYYKRWTKRLLLVLAVIIVIAFNVNTVQLAQSLWREPAVRSGVVQSAQNPTAPGGQTAASQQVQTSVDQALNLPLGWSSSTWHVDHGRWFWTIIGWLLSIAAVSLGAPFWFGVLGKVNSLRSTGPPPKT
jgi:hypothetical protein